MIRSSKKNLRIRIRRLKKIFESGFEVVSSIFESGLEDVSPIFELKYGTKSSIFNLRINFNKLPTHTCHKMPTECHRRVQLRNELASSSGNASAMYGTHPQPVPQPVTPGALCITSEDGTPPACNASLRHKCRMVPRCNNGPKCTTALPCPGTPNADKLCPGTPNAGKLLGCGPLCHKLPSRCLHLQGPAPIVARSTPVVGSGGLPTAIPASAPPRRCERHIHCGRVVTPPHTHTIAMYQPVQSIRRSNCESTTHTTTYIHDAWAISPSWQCAALLPTWNAYHPPAPEIKLVVQAPLLCQAKTVCTLHSCQCAVSKLESPHKSPIRTHTFTHINTMHVHSNKIQHTPASICIMRALNQCHPLAHKSHLTWHSMSAIGHSKIHDAHTQYVIAIHQFAHQHDPHTQQYSAMQPTQLHILPC